MFVAYGDGMIRKGEARKAEEELGGYFIYPGEREPNSFLHIYTTGNIIFITTTKLYSTWGGKLNMALSYLLAKDALDKLSAVSNNNNNYKCFCVFR